MVKDDNRRKLGGYQGTGTAVMAVDPRFEGAPGTFIAPGKLHAECFISPRWPRLADTRSRHQRQQDGKRYKAAHMLIQGCNFQNAQLITTF